MRRSLIAGNWKMNGLAADGLALAQTLAARLRVADAPAAEMLVCPPFTLLAAVGKVLRGSGIALGAQDCHPAPAGAHTGDIAASMLADAGCSHVIVGHSERRHDHGEADALVRAKAEAALGAGLVAIVCVGESEAEHDHGKTLAVVERQLAGSLPGGTTAATVVVAYEPVWAIGTGRTPTEGEVAQVHAFIRAELTGRLGGGQADGIRILYGGSVKPDNAGRLLRLDDVDGALVGGASLKADDFCAIAQSSV